MPRLSDLVLDISRWKQRWDLVPHRDEKGPIETPSERLWAYNKYVLKRDRDELSTLFDTPIAHFGRAPPPKGVEVFDSFPLDGLEEAALADIRRIFAGVENKGRDGKTMLFYQKQQVSLSNVLDKMYYSYKAYDLYEYIMRHLRAIKNSTGATDDIMERCGLTLIEYLPGAGIYAHLDNLSDFGDTFGPIFTVSMSADLKSLDLLPVLTAGEESSMRLTTTQFQTVMLQGEARSDYAHSVPRGSPFTHYTIAFKLPFVRSGTPGPDHHSPSFGRVPTIVLDVAM